MNNFTYYTPTKVVFGRGSEGQTGALVRERGCKKVLLHYGGGSAVRSGLLDRVKDSLREAGLEWTELGGALPNPRLSLVREGVDLCRREGVDFLLAVGGGSVIDSAKAMAYGAAEEGDVWDLYCGKRQARAALPVGAVLTIAAAGSEMSDSSVITNEDGWIKRGYSSDLCRPVFAVMNPELTMTLPAYQTACGCTDILMHTMERYFHPEAGMALTDSLAEALMRTVMESARVLTKEPENYEARAEVMWAGSLSHNGFTGCGAGGDWMTHKLEHELGGLYDVAHGAGGAAGPGMYTAPARSGSPGSPSMCWASPPGRMRRRPPSGALGPWRTSTGSWACPPASGSWGWRPPRRSWPCWPASARRPAAGAAVLSAAWRRPIWPPSTAWRCENGGKQEGAPPPSAETPVC